MTGRGGQQGLDRGQSRGITRGEATAGQAWETGTPWQRPASPHFAGQLSDISPPSPASPAEAWPRPWGPPGPAWEDPFRESVPVWAHCPRSRQAAVPSACRGPQQLAPRPATRQGPESRIVLRSPALPSSSADTQASEPSEGERRKRARALAGDAGHPARPDTQPGRCLQTGSGQPRPAPPAVT